jgi:hypothetical protein
MFSSTLRTPSTTAPFSTPLCSRRQIWVIFAYTSRLGLLVILFDKLRLPASLSVIRAGFWLQELGK